MTFPQPIVRTCIQYLRKTKNCIQRSQYFKRVVTAMRKCKVKKSIKRKISLSCQQKTLICPSLFSCLPNRFPRNTLALTIASFITLMLLILHKHLHAVAQVVDVVFLAVACYIRKFVIIRILCALVSLTQIRRLTPEGYEYSSGGLRLT